MYQVIHQDKQYIEIALSGEVDRDDFMQVMHQLESLITTFGKVNALLDTTDLGKHNLETIKEELNLFKEHKDSFMRIALVSDSAIEKIIVTVFNKLSNMELRTYSPDKYEDAVRWIFPSKLP